MEIVLRTGDGQPIYEQIEQQIQSSILSGRLQPGDSLPSIRHLAKMLRVSVITVQKAYDHLKADGLIESAVGRGTVVARTDPGRARETALFLVQEPLMQAVRTAKAANLSLQDLQKTLALLFEEEQT